MKTYRLNIQTALKKHVKKATKHHILTNKHHPESHKSLAAMSFVDIAEMVCDWMAMSQELGDNIDAWVAKVVGKKYKFSPKQTALIHTLVKQLKTRSE